jgi:hypothetical protein
MSYNDRIDAAQTAISEHNEAVGGEGKPGFVNSETFIQCIKATGGTTEERLSDLSYEDLLACMPDFNGVKPRLLAKDIANLFRNKKPGPSSFDNSDRFGNVRPVTAKKAERMTPRELVEAFDPEDSDNSVGKRLLEISKGQNFIVYSTGRTVDADTTFKILMEIKGGFGGRTDTDVNGKVKRVYAIGELPDNYADENPLYRDRPLRPDGTCDQLGRSWEGVALSVRQFLRVAMDEGELRITHEIAHDILDVALELPQDITLEKLQKRYRKAAVAYNEMLNTNSLPTLKISLGGGSESKHPFADGKQVVWAVDPAIPNAYVNRPVGERLEANLKGWHKAGGTYSGNVNPRK